MLSLFDSCGAGLQSHPRLICETLFVQKKSILNEIYGIPISLSAAYTYTENYRNLSYQAKRHHSGKNLNPGISLRKATRDLNKHPSVNEHYSLADLQYSLREMENYSILARDDKALVHTDVEIVQRPSKSSIRVRYADHVWEKDSNHTLAITTYQFVIILKLNSEEQSVARIGSGGVSKTRVHGNGISLVNSSLL